jgi:nitrate/nitrite transport system substrate-binding protein
MKNAGTPMKMGMVFPVSTHNYELRYWLASGGISPGYYTATDTTGTRDADVLISVTPPPQMPATLAQGHHSWLLRWRTVESAGGHPRYRRGAHH